MFNDYDSNAQVPKDTTCDICNKSFSNHSNLRKHKKSHFKQETKKSKAIRCDICDLGVRDNYQLKLHMRKHSNQRNFKCEVCLFSFTREGDLNRHKEACLGIIKNHCTSCSTVFKNKCSYNEHVLWDEKCGRLTNMKPEGNFQPDNLIRVKADSDLDWVGFLPKDSQAGEYIDSSLISELSSKRKLKSAHENNTFMKYKRSKRKFGCGICEGCIKEPCKECPSCKRTKNEKIQLCTRRKCLHPVHYYSHMKETKPALLKPNNESKPVRNDDMFVQSDENLSDLVENILPDDLNLFDDSLGFELNSDMIVMNEDVVS